MSQQHLIGIAQAKISQDANDVLVAPNLGSCVGVSVYDPVLKRGGMVHCLLPLSKADPAKAAQQPFMYVDTGVAKLIESLLAAGANRKQLIIIAAGGANINDDQNIFEIGKRNYTILKKILWKNNLLLKAESIGDTVSRTLSLDIATGKTYLKIRGETVEL